MSGSETLRAPRIEELQPHFAQYAIEAFVAVGGMGAVYRARQLSVDRPVALKILPPEMAGDEAFREHFVMEARAMAKLSHRNLVQLYDFGETDGIFWMVQEWIEGRTIFDVMHDEERLSPKEAAALVAQACEGLGYAHKQGVVHRDVKPANMMVDGEGILKLMDFGLAGMQGGGDGVEKEQGTRFATEEYAAPELWDANATIDHRVDIFALGVLLYEALTGQRPTGTFRMPSELRPGLDTRYDDIVVRAMQRSPANRYASCAEILVALRKVVTSPPQVKLQTAAKPATGGLSAKAPPPNPATPPEGPALAIVTPAPQTAQPAKRSSGLVTLCSVGALLAVLAGGWWVLTAAGGGSGETADQPEPSGSEATAASVSANPAPPKPETPQERIDRQAREHLARLEAAREQGEDGGGASTPAPEPEPEPAPEPSPAPPGIAQVLEDLDAETRARAAEPLEAYATARAELEERTLAECVQEEEQAVQAGDLDAVLFWQSEAKAIRAGRDPEENAEGIPIRAAALRAAWRKEIDPHRSALDSMQSAYLERLGEIEAAANEESAKATVRERRERAQVFRHFVALCAGKAPPFAVESPRGNNGAEGAGDLAERIVEVLPSEMVAAYRSAQDRLAEFAQSGDAAARAALIRSYGSRLVRDEKALTRERKIEAAKMVRALKEEMLVLLEDAEAALAAKPAEAQPAPRSRLELVRNGEVSDECRHDRKEWKRRGKAIQSDGSGAVLVSGRGLGAGDFRVTLTLATDQVGGSGFHLSLGDLYLIFDGENAGVEAWNPWSDGQPQTGGVQLGSIVQAGTPFRCVVERSGNSLVMQLDGKPALATTVHGGPLGPVTLGCAEAVLSVESFSLEGALIPVAAPEILYPGASAQHGRVGMTQLVRMPDAGLLGLYVVSHGEDAATVQMNRSRAGGERWEEPDGVLGANSEHGPVWSFGAAADPRRDEVWLAYAAGSANHRLFVTQGRNGGRNWSQPTEVTETAKEPGANVEFIGDGLLVRHHEAKRGRILVPMLAGGEAKEVFVLVSESGREWRRVGPLMDAAQGGVEIVEDHAGTIRVVTGVPEASRSDGKRLWVASRDGGETWGDPQPSTLPDAGIRGSLVVSEGPGRRPVWYYVTVDGGDGKGVPPRNNLTLLGSTDSGRTWRALRRFHFGRGGTPSLVPLEAGTVGILYQRSLWWNQGTEARFVRLHDLWSE